MGGLVKEELRTIVSRPWIAALGLGLVSAALAGIVSAHGGDSTSIHGCVSTSSNPRGQVTVYSLPGQSGPSNGLAGPTGSCGILGVPMDWNGQGVRGPSGPTGGAASTVVGGMINAPDPCCPSYASLFGHDKSATDNRQVIMPTAGTLKNLQVSLRRPPNVENAEGSYQFVVRKNGADTLLECSVTGTTARTCSDINPAHAVTFNGTTDTISVRSVPSGSPDLTPDIQWLATFTPS
jgi:hypothetical protein